MQFVRKFIGPRDLRLRRKQYFNLLKDNSIYDFKSKNMDEYQKKQIYSFYKKNMSNGLGYATSSTKIYLLKSSKNRCCFCGRFICENSKYPQSLNYKYLAIEHYKEECRYPLKVLDWNNLFPSCNECNNNRASKEITYLSSPADREYAKDIKKLLFLSNGEIVSKDGVLNSIFDAYGLNSDEIKYQRSVFFEQIINPFFNKMLELEREKDVYNCGAILFIDEYKNVSHLEKMFVSHKKSKLYKLSKEVLTSE